MEEIVDILESTQVVEMASGVNALVPLTPEQVREVAGDDPDPKFATYIIEGGWSKSKRYYGPQVMQEICDQINENGDIVGYKGHISPEQRPYAFPDIQFRWVKSKLQLSGEKVKLFAKAYLLPGSKAREYADRGLKVPISIAGDADQRPIRGGVEVRNYDLESIDMARPRKAGMGGRLVTVSSEMEGGKEVDGKEIAALSYDELKTHNPLLVEKIENDAKKPLNDQVTEMEAKQESAEENETLISKLRKALGIDDDADVLEVVGTTLAELKKNAEKAREGILDGILEKRFKNEKDRKLVRRVLATEMSEIELPDESDAAKVKVTEMVNKFIDEDEELKELATEMESGGGNDLGDGKEKVDRQNGNKREIKDGFENERIAVRKAR